MAMILTQIKNTVQEVIYHFDCVTASSDTIVIADLACGTQVRNTDAPKVNIVRFLSTGFDSAGVRVTRSGKNIIACAPENAPFLDFTSNGWTESIHNDADIIITSDVAVPVTGYIVLRKVQGWNGTVENATYGSYDDPTRVGASTTVFGSPDKV